LRPILCPLPLCATTPTSGDIFGAWPAARDLTLIERGMAHMGWADPKKEEPLVIRPDIIIVSNPRAGNGKAVKYVQRLVNAAALMAGNGDLRFEGDISLVMTDANLDQRIMKIKEAIISKASGLPPYVIAVGGDGTFADVGTAALQTLRAGFKSVIIPAPAGTARDMSRELGVPRNPAMLFRFLAEAVPIKLGAISVWFDGGPERLLMHSMGFGVSGAVFHEVQKFRDKGGGVTVASYLRSLARGVYETEPFYVSVNGASRVAVGEVLTLFNSTSVGGVTRVPLPIHGGRIHLIPVDVHRRGLFQLEQGITALGDVFGRGMLYMLGQQRVISPGEEIPVLSGQYTIDVLQGDGREIEFTNASGRTHQVKGLLNGDTIGDVGSIFMKNTGEMIDSLASPNCGFLIRKGEKPPSFY
ncbi:MAG: diacylglycerol kinase family protein, partial [Pseudomonadota bacterium]